MSSSGLTWVNKISPKYGLTLAHIIHNENQASKNMCSIIFSETLFWHQSKSISKCLNG